MIFYPKLQVFFYPTNIGFIFIFLFLLKQIYLKRL